MIKMYYKIIIKSKYKKLKIGIKFKNFLLLPLLFDCICDFGVSNSKLFL